MISFAIEGSNLKITNGEMVILTIPAIYVGLNTLPLYQSDQHVYLYNLAQGTHLSIFEEKLSNCFLREDPFTVSSMIEFAESNFGSLYVSPNPEAASSELQEVSNDYLKEINRNTVPFFNQNIEENTDTKTIIVGKMTNSGFWLLQKITEPTSGSIINTVMQYASIRNNSDVLTYADAWTNRNTLTYSEINELL